MLKSTIKLQGSFDTFIGLKDPLDNVFLTHFFVQRRWNRVNSSEKIKSVIP